MYSSRPNRRAGVCRTDMEHCQYLCSLGPFYRTRELFSIADRILSTKPVDEADDAAYAMILNRLAGTLITFENEKVEMLAAELSLPPRFVN